MEYYKISREGNKLVVEILPSVPDMEAMEIIDSLQENIVDYIEEELFGPVEDDDDTGLDEFFDDDEDYYDDHREESSEPSKSMLVGSGL